MITHVPGPRMPLYLLEAGMLEIHPRDRDLVPDLRALVLATERAFAELRRAAGVGRG